MTNMRVKNGLLLTAAAASVFLLSGCFQSQAQTQGTSKPSDTSSASASSSPSSSGSSTPSSTGTTTAPGVGLCKAASLTPSVDSTGGGAAGSVYMKLIFTNTGTEPCVLKGFPGVSLTTGPSGDPIGAAATRDVGQVSEVVLNPGKAGIAQLRYTQAGNYPDCTQVSAAGFRVYPPEDTASVFIPQQHQACSNAAINLLSVQAFQAG